MGCGAQKWHSEGGPHGAPGSCSGANEGLLGRSSPSYQAADQRAALSAMDAWEGLGLAGQEPRSRRWRERLHPECQGWERGTSRPAEPRSKAVSDHEEALGGASSTSKEALPVILLATV